MPTITPTTTIVAATRTIRASAFAHTQEGISHECVRHSEVEGDVCGELVGLEVGPVLVGGGAALGDDDDGAAV